MDADDTIAAPASAPGGGLRGVLRVSGPAAIACADRCFRSHDGQPLAAVKGPRVVAGEFRLPPPLGALPAELYVWPGRRSYTRQPCVELHTLGSPPLLDAALRAICKAGARLAAPGEFTLRAFLAGRLDLTQAEAVLGVIDARSRGELDVALGQLAGGLAGPLHQLRDQLLDVLAQLEAGLDFVEEDIEFITDETLAVQLQSAAARVSALAARMASRAVAGAVFRVVLCGWPNVGKSSLLNALVGAPAAIVSDAAGTTRDYVTRPLCVAGFDCLLIDTAGFEPGRAGGVAAAAQALSAEQAERAHLQLFCIDATRPLLAAEREALGRPPATERLLVLTKVDAAGATDGVHRQDALLGADATGSASADSSACGSTNTGEASGTPIPGVEQSSVQPVIATSSRTGVGLAALRAAIAERIAGGWAADGGVVAGTAMRCHESLRLAAEGLERARETAACGAQELVAAEVRGALDELGKVVGAVYTDDLLDRIFSRFCIGK